MGIGIGGGWVRGVAGSEGGLVWRGIVVGHGEGERSEGGGGGGERRGRWGSGGRGKAVMKA